MMLWSLVGLCVSALQFQVGQGAAALQTDFCGTALTLKLCSMPNRSRGQVILAERRRLASNRGFLPADDMGLAWTCQHCKDCTMRAFHKLAAHHQGHVNDGTNIDAEVCASMS
jgi:hypothetical protein